MFSKKHLQTTISKIKNKYQIYSSTSNQTILNYFISRMDGIIFISFQCMDCKIIVLN